MKQLLRTISKLYWNFMKNSPIWRKTNYLFQDKVTLVSMYHMSQKPLLIITSFQVVTWLSTWRAFWSITHVLTQENVMNLESLIQTRFSNTNIFLNMDTILKEIMKILQVLALWDTTVQTVNKLEKDWTVNSKIQIVHFIISMLLAIIRTLVWATQSSNWHNLLVKLNFLTDCHVKIKWVC